MDSRTKRDHYDQLYYTAHRTLPNNQLNNWWLKLSIVFRELFNFVLMIPGDGEFDMFLGGLFP